MNSARGLADGKDGVGVSEDQTFGCKLIETRRLQKVRAGKPGLLPAQIVGEDGHDVQRLSFDSLRLMASNVKIATNEKSSVRWLPFALRKVRSILRWE